MTAPLAFFLLGIPVAFLAERLILMFTAEGAEEAAPGRKRLPWQLEPWAGRLRIGLVLAVPVLMAASAARFDVGGAVAVSLLLVALLVCTATDLLRYRVPNAVTYPGIALALIGATVLSGGQLIDALLAAGLSTSVFLPIWALTGGGIGLADVKLAVFIAAALGLPAAFTALALGVLAAGVVMLMLLLAGVVSRRQVTPYAPFLAVSAIIIAVLNGTAFAPL